MKTREDLMRMIMFFIIMLNLVRFPIPYRIGFDKNKAEEILKEAYKPLEDFVKSGVSIDSEELILAPDNVKSQKDFIRLFDNKINTRLVEGFYEDIVIEKEGTLYIDKKVYIPNIHAEDSKMTAYYIRKSKSLNSFFFGHDDEDEENLVIKERWKISGEWHRRSNYFVKNENGEWVLDRFNGTSLYGFVEASHNPWNYLDF